MFALTACNALDIIPSDSYSDPVVWQDQNLIKMYVNDQYNALVGQDNFYRYSFFSDEVYHILFCVSTHNITPSYFLIKSVRYQLR